MTPCDLLSSDNPQLSSRASVTVNVLDVNEFPPELMVPVDTFVCEDAGVGQVTSFRLLRYFHHHHDLSSLVAVTFHLSS